MSQAYPLHWPTGWPRTEPVKREQSKFNTTVPRALDFVTDEVRRLGGKNLVISSNCTLGSYRPDDPGVAVFFAYQGINAAIPCDRWRKVEDNLHAIAKTIEAMRGIERWGAKHMLKAAFTGFAALPAPGKASARGWREVLGVAADERNRQRVEECYRISRSKTHPDKPGGNAEEFDAVQRAWDVAQQELA